MSVIAHPEYDVSFLDEIANSDEDDYCGSWIHLARAVLGPTDPRARNIVLRVFIQKFLVDTTQIISDYESDGADISVELPELLRWDAAARLLPDNFDVYTYVDEEEDYDDPMMPE